jgi:hypothetical protein
MNQLKYQALEASHSQVKRLINAYLVLSTGCLGWSIVGGHLAPAFRLGLSFGALIFSQLAKEAGTQSNQIEEKLDRFRYHIQELERTESALEFALAKVSLEDSYGLIIPEPEIPEIKALAKAEPNSEPKDWDNEFTDDFGLSALAPDAKEAIRSWLSLDFACSSKIICAASGSGKSSYLQWEYRQAANDRTTYLIDGHLLANHLEGFTWTGSKESDLRIVSHNEFQISRTLEDLIAEIKARLQGSRPLDPIHILIDESDGNVFKSEPIKSLLPELIELVANEARKTRVTVSLVTHSVQKQKTGLDASDLCQIRWLILGNALATPFSRWPGDLNPKVWRAKQSQLQSTLDPDQARACVLYSQSGISLEILELSALK